MIKKSNIFLMFLLYNFNLFSETILVTGGAGFIGSHVCRQLLLKKHRIICIDNFNKYYDPNIKKQNIQDLITNKNFQLKKLSINHFKDLKKIFEQEKISFIIHLAARAGVRPSIENPFIYEKTNIKGTLNILECAKKYHTKKIVVASSSSVYGNNKKIPFSEKDNTENQISPYAATKKMCEILCKNYHLMYGLNIVCLRFFTVYGPSGRPDMAIYKFIDNISKEKVIQMYGDGNSSRDYTYIDDIVNGIIASLKCPSTFEIINLGNSHPTKLKKLISIIEIFLNKKALIEIKDIPMGDVEKTYADISKASQLIQYKPTTSIEEGIKKTIEWYKKTI